MNDRLDHLIRKNQGKDKLKSYQDFFKLFNLKELTYIALEESDTVLSQVGKIFRKIEFESDELNPGSKESVLLNEILQDALIDDRCYIFTDDVYQCGMFSATTKSAIEACINIAFLAYDNTCFLTDTKFRFSFTVNYYDKSNINEPKLYNIYEVQRKVLKEIIKK